MAHEDEEEDEDVASSRSGSGDLPLGPIVQALARDTALPAPELLTIDQAATVLNVPRSWLRDKVTARQVPHVRLGRHVRFATEHLAQIIAAGEEVARPVSSPTGGRHGRRRRPAV